MRTILLLITLNFIGIANAVESCTFDQENQKRIVEGIAKSNPHGKLDVIRRQITWNKNLIGTTTFSYGGCDDLGSIVRRESIMTKPRTQQQVLKLALELATRFWSNKYVLAHEATEAMRGAIDGSKFEMEILDNGALYRVPADNFLEVSIIHTYANGVDRVEVVWHRGF